MIILRLIFESFRFAFLALKQNPLRTMLSLGGVTIGIFAIILVLTIVDSLERSIKSSFEFLGAGVVYVEKWPWVGSPDFPWWKYMKRPEPSYEEFKLLEDKLENKEAIIMMVFKGNATIKSKNNSVGNINVMGATYEYDKLFQVDLEEGRYFTVAEIDRASNVAIIGQNIKTALFPDETAVGKSIKIGGAKFVVIGTFKKQGQSFLKTNSDDENVIVPMDAFRKIYEAGGPRSPISASIGIKGLSTDPGLDKLKSEVMMVLRSSRGLKPKEENTFELNTPEAIANEISKVFAVLKLAGWIIGAFSILIGGFGIANIMFVSVKERTNIIGIQKSLGAKNYFILLQFLFESIYLSALGGIFGLMLVFPATFIPLGDLTLQMSFENILTGIGIASFTGVLSGILPAFQASRMNPVQAIRSN